jgi:hypothetical protein
LKACAPLVCVSWRASVCRLELRSRRMRTSRRLHSWDRKIPKLQNLRLSSLIMSHSLAICLGQTKILLCRQLIEDHQESHGQINLLVRILRLIDQWLVQNMTSLNHQVVQLLQILKEPKSNSKMMAHLCTISTKI